MGTPALRPRRVGEILDAAIKLYLGNARVLMGAAASVVVPLQILSGVLLLSTYSDGRDIAAGFSTIGRTITPAEAHARLGASAIVQVAGLIGTTLTLAACVKAISDAYLDQPPSIGTSLRFGLRRLPALIALEIVYFLGLILGFILLIIPGIWLYGAWSVRVPALLIERRGPFRALGRSRRLVKGRWWPTVGVLAVSAVMVMVLSGVIVGALTAVALTSSHPSVLFAVVINSLAAIVSALLLQPFSAAVTTVLYYDLRVRHEGYDLQLMAEQLGLPESALPGGEEEGFTGALGPELVGKAGGPPYWPPPPGWQPER